MRYVEDLGSREYKRREESNEPLEGDVETIESHKIRD
jgi:hypothetical protein